MFYIHFVKTKITGLFSKVGRDVRVWVGWGKCPDMDSLGSPSPLRTDLKDPRRVQKSQGGR